MEEPSEIPGHFELRTPDERDLAQSLEDTVGDPAGSAQARELPLLLDRAQALDGPAARHEIEARLPQALVLTERQRRLEADAAGERLGELADRVAARLHRLDARDGARLVDVPEVGEQPHAVALDEQRRVRAVEAAEVAHVDEIGDEQRLLQPFGEALEAVRHGRSFRYRSASR